MPETVPGSAATEPFEVIGPSNFACFVVHERGSQVWQVTCCEGDCWRDNEPVSEHSSLTSATRAASQHRAEHRREEAERDARLWPCPTCGRGGTSL